MARLCPAGVPAGLGVAVSGGGDSLALLVLLADWARPRGAALRVVSVDHGLRPEAGAEIALAAQAAQRMGLAHDVLHWDGTRARGNLMAAARAARHALIADWATEQGVAAVALGHTLDDQAETVLMRLARGSGVDGLAGMAPRRRAHGVEWLRPLLATRRDDLRTLLRARGIDWADDPTNADPRFGRTRARAALGALAPLGIDAPRLAATAAQMADARAALAAQARAAAARLMRMEHGDILLDRAGLLALPAELRERLVAQALCTLARQPYRPRLRALRRALDGALGDGKRATLHGCQLSADRGLLRIAREWAAVRDVVAAPGALWDGRWVLHPPPGDVDTAGLRVRALGRAGLARCAGRRETALPHASQLASQLASPAVWRGADLVAAPLAGWARGWRAECRQGPAEVLAALFPH